MEEIKSESRRLEKYVKGEPFETFAMCESGEAFNNITKIGVLKELSKKGLLSDSELKELLIDLESTQ